MSLARQVVKVGDIKIAAGAGTLAALGLGSCVAIVVYDPVAKVGGLAHTLLPDPSNGRKHTAPGRFVTAAVPILLDNLEAAGASRDRLVGRLVGGASMFAQLLSESGRTLGLRNVNAAREALERAGVPVRGEEVGGSRGRSVYFRVDDGELRVTSVGQPDVLL